MRYLYSVFLYPKNRPYRGVVTLDGLNENEDFEVLVEGYNS